MLLRKILLIGLCLSAEANQEIKIIGDNNIVNQIQGLSPQTVTKFMKPYKERIIYLEGQLRNTVSIEEKYRLSEEGILHHPKKLIDTSNQKKTDNTTPPFKLNAIKKMTISRAI